MDTIEYCENINDISDLIVKYFDEIMALYDLVGRYQVLSITTDTSESITFILKFESIEDASKIKELVEGKEVTKYGHIFVPTIIQNGAELNITFVDRL